MVFFSSHSKRYVYSHTSPTTTTYSNNNGDNTYVAYIAIAIVVFIGSIAAWKRYKFLRSVRAPILNNQGVNIPGPVYASYDPQFHPIEMNYSHQYNMMETGSRIPQNPGPLLHFDRPNEIQSDYSQDRNYNQSQGVHATNENSITHTSTHLENPHHSDHQTTSNSL